MTDDAPKIRLDKWLWHARFFKTRTLAAKQVSGGHVRVNANKVDKAATKVGPGDTLTFPQGTQIRVVEIAACGLRRGPAPEAQALYLDKSPVQQAKPKAPGADRVGGRPTKKDRRSLDLSRDRGLE
ncbi:RNA-binding S4 domain-containing protein [Litoreibacter janthinus]|uniref:Heat shock protein Hsp15 n=1 Tax=Litoreibacter janthinus TaxID=670154 RepID=A0A1I6HL01_9RHOB|nr:RNA-binding S4 domain-containing protein [Litoreibacter janthinus]SFR55112.1 heat shock protein Hsp15 [Litoreibacter janthinus]